MTARHQQRACGVDKKPRSSTSFACCDAQRKALTQSKRKIFSTLIKHRTCSFETMRKKEENVKKKVSILLLIARATSQKIEISRSRFKKI
jgi:hypothetical protein